LTLPICTNTVMLSLIQFVAAGNECQFAPPLSKAVRFTLPANKKTCTFTQGDPSFNHCHFESHGNVVESYYYPSTGQLGIVFTASDKGAYVYFQVKQLGVNQPSAIMQVWKGDTCGFDIENHHDLEHILIY
jgi:hypothetical protein